VFDFLPVDMKALMHVGHEFVEVHATLADDGAGLEKKIHQHRLAAADLSVDVKALDWRTRLFAFSEEPAKRRRFARQPVLIDPLLKRRQSPAQHGLAGIGLDLSGRNERRIAGAEGFGHETRAEGWVCDTYGERGLL